MLRHLCCTHFYMARVLPIVSRESLFDTRHFVSESWSGLTNQQSLFSSKHVLRTSVLHRTHTSTRFCLHSTCQSPLKQGPCVEIESRWQNSGVRPRTPRQRHLVHVVGTRDEGLLRGVILGIETSCDETGAAVVQSLIIERWGLSTNLTGSSHRRLRHLYTVRLNFQEFIEHEQHEKVCLRESHR